MITDFIFTPKKTENINNKSITETYSPYGTTSLEVKDIQKVSWRDIGYKVGKNQRASLVMLEHERNLLKSKLEVIWKAQLDELKMTKEINKAELNNIKLINGDVLKENKAAELTAILSRLEVYEEALTSYMNSVDNDPIYRQCEMELTAGFELGASEYKNSEDYKQTIFARLTSN